MTGPPPADQGTDEPGQPRRRLPAAAGGRDLPVPGSALAIGAHPDDVEFGCGATLAKWAAQGCTVHHLVLTDGSKGTWDPDADAARLVEVRQREQRAAARALGATGQVVFLGWTDGELASGLAERERVAWWIRRLRPAVVLGHDPWRRYRLHPDHRHAGFLTCDGIVAARDPHFFAHQRHGPDAVAPHRPDALLLWEADEPDHVEDVTGHLDAKLAALEAHESQFESTMKVGGERAGEQLAAFRARIRQRAEEIGRRIGVAHGEAFKLVTSL